MRSMNGNAITRETWMDPKFKSRKFILAAVVGVLAVIVPPFYNHMGIADSVTMMVLGMISTVSATYGIVEGKIDQAKVKSNDQTSE